MPGRHRTGSHRHTRCSIESQRRKEKRDETQSTLKVQSSHSRLVFSGALVLTAAKSAQANPGPGSGEAGFVLLVVAAVVTYATVLATICTPVAAFKARDHEAGFAGAFKDCWYWYRSSQESASTATGETETVMAQAEAESIVVEE